MHTLFPHFVKMLLKSICMHPNSYSTLQPSFHHVHSMISIIFYGILILGYAKSRFVGKRVFGTSLGQYCTLLPKSCIIKCPIWFPNSIDNFHRVTLLGSKVIQISPVSAEIRLLGSRKNQLCQFCSKPGRTKHKTLRSLSIRIICNRTQKLANIDLFTAVFLPKSCKFHPHSTRPILRTLPHSALFSKALDTRSAHIPSDPGLLPPFVLRNNISPRYNFRPPDLAHALIRTFIPQKHSHLAPTSPLLPFPHQIPHNYTPPDIYHAPSTFTHILTHLHILSTHPYIPTPRFLRHDRPYYVGSPHPVWSAKLSNVKRG